MPRLITVSPLLFLCTFACSGGEGESSGEGDGDAASSGGVGDGDFGGDGDASGDGDVATGGGTSVGTGGASQGGNAAGGATGSTGGATGSGGPVSMAYILDLEQWGGTSALDLLDYSASDYVIHAFYTADGSGNLVSVNDTVDSYRNAGLVDKVHAAGKRIVMSLGGANHSGPLKTVAANASLRATFAANVVTKINEWGYDGVDLDLEFPVGGNEPQDQLDLMTELHNAVKANNPAHLTMFGIGPGYYNDQYFWAQLASVSDYGFYFCYDWDWPGVTPANGPIKNPGVNYTAYGGAQFEASCSGAMNYIIGQGYPASQLIVGFPYYANGGAHYSTIPQSAKDATPHPDYLEAEDPNSPGAYWTNVASMQMKIDAVLDPTQSALTGGATASGIGWWEWGYEDPANPELTSAIKAKLGK